MGLLFINQFALVWTGLWPIFSILQLWVLDELMASLSPNDESREGNSPRVCVFVCVCRGADVFTVCLKQGLW